MPSTKAWVRWGVPFLSPIVMTTPSLLYVPVQGVMSTAGGSAAGANGAGIVIPAGSAISSRSRSAWRRREGPGEAAVGEQRDGDALGRHHPEKAYWPVAAPSCP